MKKPCLYKRSDTGNYSIVYYVDGKQKGLSTGVSNKDAAKTIFNKWLEQNAGGIIIKSPVLLSEFYKIFVALSTKRNEGTLANYSGMVKHFISVCGDRMLKDYNLIDFDKYITSLIPVKSLYTVKAYRGCLYSIFETAEMYDYIPHNPLRRAVNISLIEPDTKCLSKEEFNRLIRAVDTYTNRDMNKMFMNPQCKLLYKDLFTFAILSGLRQAELFKLKPEHIDSQFIKVLSTPSDPTKTGRTRYVEINPLLHPIIDRRSQGTYIFTGNKSHSMLNSRYILMVLKKFGDVAGIPYINFKMFRSTFGKFLIDDGVPILFVSQQLGHKSVVTTQKFYAKYITSEYKGWNKTAL